MTTTIAFLQGTSEVGGSDIALLRLVAALDPHKYRAIVALPRSGPLEPLLRSAGAEVHIVPVRQLRSTRSLSYQARFVASFWPAAYRLARLARSTNADVIYSNSMYALAGPWAARFASLPHICHVREIPDAPAPLTAAIVRSMVGGSRQTIAMTHAVAQGLGPRFRGDSRVNVIPDGIDLTEFHPSISGLRIRGSLGVPPDQPLVGFVARLDPWKGADVFLRAAALLSEDDPAIRFLVCGGELKGYEEYAQSLKRLAGRLGLEGKVHFTGWDFRLADIPEVMAALDVFVHSSIRPEPFGLVLVEAMATAIPVVASADGGVPEVVIDGETGILFEPRDHASLAAAVGRLLSDASLRREMGRAGRARAERYFEVSAYARRVEAVIDRAAPSQA